MSGASASGREDFLSHVSAYTQEREDLGMGGVFSGLVLLSNDLSLSKDRLVEGLDSVDVVFEDFLDTGRLLELGLPSSGAAAAG